MSPSQIRSVLSLLPLSEARVAVACAALAAAGGARASMIGHSASPAHGGGAANGVRASAGSVHIHIGGGFTGSQLVTGKGTVYEKKFDLDLTAGNLGRLSHDLSTLNSEAIRLDPKGLNHIGIDTTGNTVNGRDLKVYTVDGSRPGSVSTIRFGGGTGEETIVVNVLGRTVDWQLPPNPADGGKVIWNFVDQPDGIQRYESAQAFHLNQRLQGTILAPVGDGVPNAGIREGSIGPAWNTGRNAAGMDRSLLGKTVVVAAPEPAGVMTMAGFLGLALFSRRRSAAVRL